MRYRSCFLAWLILLSSSLSATAAELSVFAASSLTEALTEIVQHYERQYPEDQILLNFAGSQTLAMQLEQGAPADLFISANQEVMERLQADRLVNEGRILIGNRLTVATRSDLQPPLTQLRDLARPDLLVVVGNGQVPVGRYTRLFFSHLASDQSYGTELVTQIKSNVISEENRAKAIVAKLRLGEADAGIAYQSDINNSDLRSLPLPDSLNPLVTYPLAKVSGGDEQAGRLYSFLLSTAAQQIFQKHGFLSGREL